MKDVASDQLSHINMEIDRLNAEIRRLQSGLKHERELRASQIDSLHRELADAQEKTELRLRLEIAEKLRQLPRGE